MRDKEEAARQRHDSRRRRIVEAPQFCAADALTFVELPFIIRRAMTASADDLELPSRVFRPRIYGVGAWTENLHFAYDLIATLRPGLFVELGTDRGESYFAFCQAAAEQHTGTRCFAVDTWRGDPHVGGYDETTFMEVSAHNAEHYSSFSTLLRCTFDEALERFAPESIDLLHLDGFHSEEAVRHDVSVWLPKIRPGGLLLLHDIAVRTRGFGVWKIWEELTARGRSYAFTAGPGLGVWQKPRAESLPLHLEYLLSESGEAAERVAQFYSDRARELQERIARQWQDGTIGQTAAGQQTIIQVFHTVDGIHREEDSVGSRIGHESWKDVTLTLPPGSGAAPLRIDFVSALHVIEIASIAVREGEQIRFVVDDARTFSQIEIRGDAQRCLHPSCLRLKITGVDPQLYLPTMERIGQDAALTVRLRLRVLPHARESS